MAIERLYATDDEFQNGILYNGALYTYRETIQYNFPNLDNTVKFVPVYIFVNDEVEAIENS